MIPASGGSKGVPRKNILPLAGKPLLTYTFEVALSRSLTTDVVVSTDDPEVRKFGLEAGAQSPFLRPPELTTDSALDISTVKHAVGEMEEKKGSPYDFVVMLQPTTPLRAVQDLTETLTQLIASKADERFSVKHVDNTHPMKMKEFDGQLLADYESQRLNFPTPDFAFGINCQLRGFCNEAGCSSGTKHF